MQKAVISNDDNLQDGATNDHTEEIQEIIDKVPSWIISWGIAIFGGILIIFAVISMLITYPDIVKAGVRIESSTPSVAVVANVQGRLSKILVTSGEKVKKGQLLALLDSAGETVHVHRLIASQNGNVKFVSVIEVGYYLQSNQQAFIISPDDERFFGLITLQQNHINEIKLGQTVTIKLNGIASHNVGKLKGVISYIADIPDSRGMFSLKVSLKPYSKSIKIDDWMTGQAEILTRNVSVATRVYDSIISGLK